MDNKEATEKWTDEILARYQQKTGNMNLPIDEKILVTAVEELKGIKIELQERQRVSGHSSEGILMPMIGRFILRYETNLYRRKEPISNPRARKRFTIGHELGHILFYDCSYRIPKLLASPPEYTCHKIARELLLPKETVKKKFCQEYDSTVSFLSFLRKFAKAAKVSLYPLAIRLTEDLPLLKDVMITFWTYKGNRFQSEICYKDFDPDSKTCAELKKLLPAYWRRRIRMKVWEEAVREVATNGTTISKRSLCVKRKRRKNGKAKHILFDIECETRRRPNQKSLLKWTNQAPAYNVISIEKFNLNTLQKRK